MASVVSRIVEVCAFRFVQDHSEYLLLKRSQDDKIHPGIWQIVTGTVDEGEKALHAALREFTEETGLISRRFWIVPYINSFYDRHRDVVNMIPFFAAQIEVGGEPKLSAEHSTYEWLSYEQARRRLVWPGQRKGLEIVEQYIVGGQEAACLTSIPL